MRLDAAVLRRAIPGWRCTELRKPIIAAIVLIVVAGIITAKITRSRIGGPEKTAPKSPRAALEAALADHKPVWLLIHSTMCIPCIEMEKVSARLKPAFKGRIEFVNVIVDDPNAADVLKEYKIELIPTSYFIDGSGKVVEKRVGAIPIAEMRKKLAKLAVKRK